MEFTRGLLYGLIAGLILIGISTGIVSATPEARENAQRIGTIGLILAFGVSILRPFKKPVISHKVDGFLIGFGMSVKIVAVILYGFTFP